MLLNFGAKNFYCFKEGVDVSLELGANCPKEISRGQNVSNILCIKGANGSGKTSLIKILSLLKNFCCDSWNLKPDAEISLEGFFYSNNPTEIYCEFTTNGIQYLYESTLQRTAVLTEKLSRKKNRYTLVFERVGDKLVKRTAEFAELDEIKLRSNASLISTANQYEVECLKSIYSFFQSIMTNVSWYGRYEFSNDTDYLSQYYNNNPNVLDTARTILKESDLGISDIQIHSRENEEGVKIYFPVFFHDTDVKRNYLFFVSQSSGTQTIFRNIPYYFYVLSQGGILAMDEFDKDLHPHLLPKIIDFFDNESTNPRNAQLIITAHNTQIIDRLGKYRTFLLNKEKCESYGYRLDEIPGELIRNDRSIEPLYNKGKLGGVPLL